MSKICLCAIDTQNTNIDGMKENLVKMCNELSIGVFFNEDLFEPCIQSLNLNSPVSISFSDDFRFNNCEKLLMPSYADKDNNSFKKRIEKIRVLLDIMLAYYSKIDVFLGDSGEVIDDFVIIEVFIDEFVDKIMPLSETFLYSDSYHFIVSNKGY